MCTLGPALRHLVILVLELSLLEFFGGLFHVSRFRITVTPVNRDDVHIHSPSDPGWQNHGVPARKEEPRSLTSRDSFSHE